jgi:hypothetical protein
VKRALKNALKRGGFHFYRLASRFGLHVVPVHYYSPLSDLRDLERTVETWARKSDLPGLDFDREKQARNLQEVCLAYQEEYYGNQVYRKAVAERYGPGFGYLEAQALHAFLRHLKPRRVIEVGSGVSTLCMLQALARNQQEGCPACHLTCVEPYPSSKLKALQGIELLEKRVQEVPWAFFQELQAGDFLFIDSSHVVKPGSDVNYLILEVLPRLRAGVYVHFHDIYWPYDYPRDLLHNFFAGAESSLLRAFFVHNNRTRVVFCMSYLHYEAPEVLKQVFPEYDRQPDERGLTYKFRKPFEEITSHFPSSLYFQITG